MINCDITLRYIGCILNLKVPTVYRTWEMDRYLSLCHLNVAKDFAYKPRASGVGVSLTTQPSLALGLIVSRAVPLLQDVDRENSTISTQQYANTRFRTEVETFDEFCDTLFDTFCVELYWRIEMKF
jgi:hypothetical protein